MQWTSQFPYSTREIVVGGDRMRCVDEGTGEPILMVHGNPTWSFYFRHLIHAFRTSHRTIAPDHIGCGFSDKPQQGCYDVRRHADNLLALVRQLDLHDITLVVHDWGGAIGLLAACDMPLRFRRMVLLNTGAFPPPFVPWRIRVCRWPVIGQWAVQGANLFALAATRMALHDPARMSASAKAGMLSPYDSWSHRRAIYQFVRDIPVTRNHPTWPILESLEGNLHRLAHLPTCMIWGMRDWCFRPSCLTRFRRHFPQATVHELPDVGHWVLEEAPDVVESHLRAFLAAGQLPLCPPHVTDITSSS